ncbi:MAG: hypothetical protein AAF492_01600 [Verrucomicrobiota bacterium]
MKRCFVLLFVLSLYGNVSVEARTWTSVKGSKVEAEFVRVEGRRVILKRPDGSLIRIAGSSLILEDRKYIAAQMKKPKAGDKDKEYPDDEFANLPARTEPEKKDPPATKPKPAPKKSDGPFSYAEASPFSVEDFAGLKLEDAANGVYLGLQYGPGEQDVVYVAFDAPDFEKPPETMFVYAPGSKLYNKTMALKGKKKTVAVANAKGKASFFPPLKFSSEFGDIKADYEINMQYGVKSWSLLYVATEVKLTKTRGASSGLELRGYMGEHVTEREGTIKVMPLLKQPALSLSSRAAGHGLQLRMDVKMGSQRILPGKSMKDDIELAYTDDKDKKAGKEKVELTEERMYNSTPISHTPKKLKPGRGYSALASIDLGPLFGTLEASKSFTMPEKKKD